ncbi:MAG: hypothetical protein M1389_14425 [Chloroflexi bacterium]|nr:hypothetical protein [Chloroflexota bacterium]
MTIDLNRVVIRASEFMATGFEEFFIRYAPGEPPPVEAVRQHAAQALVDGEMDAVGCAVVSGGREANGEWVVVVAVRFRVVRRPFPACQSSPLRQRLSGEGDRFVHLFLEPTRAWLALDPAARDWFFSSTPIRWKGARGSLRFRGELRADLLRPLGDGDRAIVRESYDAAIYAACAQALRGEG